MDVENTSERIVPTENWVSVIHPHMPTVDKALQLDGSIDHKHTFDIFHEPTDLATKSPLEFIVHPTPNYYLDLQSFYIDVKLQINKADGTRNNIANWKAYFLNNLSQSLWSVIKVYLNDTNVESNYFNQQVSNLTHILTTPNQLVKERGFIQGAFAVGPETLVRVVDADHMAVDIIQDRTAFSKSNTLHIKRPLHLDVSTCDKFLVDGVKVRIVLEPSAPQILIKGLLSNAPNAENYNYTFKSVIFECTKIKPSDGALLATAKMIVNRPFEYILRRNIMQRVVMDSGHQEHTLARPFQDLIPNLIYIYMVDREGASGNYGRSPFYYDDYGLKHYSVKINGIQIAGGETDRVGGYVGEYLDSMRAHGGDYFIPYKNYMTGCFVLCVNTNDQSAHNSLNIEKKGNLTISLSFAAPLARAAIIHIVGAVDSTCEIDVDRNITTHFQY